MREEPVAGGSRGSRSGPRFSTGRPGGVQESHPIFHRKRHPAPFLLYREVLERQVDLIQGVVQAKRPRRFSVMLTNGFGQIHNIPPRRGTPMWVPYAFEEEIHRLLGRLQGTPRLMAMLLSGAGLRLMECTRPTYWRMDTTFELLGAFGSQGCEHDHDLHTRSESRRTWRLQSGGPALNNDPLA